ncbi:MAG: PRC-barrel domain-containing protein [Planctomycetota bacterium]
MYSQIKKVCLLCVASIALIGVSQAQEKQKPEHDMKTQAHHRLLSDVLGADVRMKASDEAIREAREDNEQPDRPAGTIEDLLIDSRSKKVEWVVISFGGLIGIGDKTVAVPVKMVDWNQAKKCFDLSATEEQLEKQKEFDLDEAKESGFDSAVKAVQSSWVALGIPEQNYQEQDREKAKIIEGTTFTIVPMRLSAASEIADLPVYAKAKEWGEIEKAFFDVKSMRVAAVVVEGDEHQFLVPFDALHHARDKGERALVIEKTPEELKGCTTYEEPKSGLVDPAALKRSREFFGLPESSTFGF